jgi:sugar/nucleoside kinase (ribokinase family)
MYDLLVVGEINVDLILQDNVIEPQFGREILVQDALLTMGSSSVIMACGAARLGLRVAFFGLLGDDELGAFMLRQMAARGVDVSPIKPDPALRTGLTVSLSTAQDRAMITFMGTIDQLRAEQAPLDDLAQGANPARRHLHIGSFFLQSKLRPGLPELLCRAKAHGFTTSLDFGWDPEGRWNGDLAKAMVYADVLVPNETEALHITGAETPEQALETLAALVPVVAVKLGPRGAIAARGAERAGAPATPAEVVDTTGAGDSFDAGFIYGYVRGWSLERALRLACACGSLSTRANGGTTAQATLEEAMAAAGLS